MNLDQIKSKLNSITSSSKGGAKKNTNKWKPVVGKASIRVVPNKFNKENPFTELFIYYGIDNKTILSPKCYGEKDPIADFVAKLRKTNDKENWRLAKKIEAKMRVFLPIVVRGEEEKGVRLWEFGKETYMDFLNLADNEDVGDFTDIVEGRDITVTTVGPETTGTEYNKSNIMPRTKQTQLSEDKAEVKKWLDEQPNPIDNFKKYSYDEIKASLQAFISPEDEVPADGIPGKDDEEDDLPFTVDPPKKSTPLAKTPKADKFDKLFDKD